jgi:peptidyl-prolyl cis-trans isomerase D
LARWFTKANRALGIRKSTNVGDVKRFEVANMGNVIAKLKKVNEKGMMAVDDARPGIEPT